MRHYSITVANILLLMHVHFTHISLYLLILPQSHNNITYKPT